VLLQRLHLLFQLDDRVYARMAPAPYSASIGSHFRRILERLQCLVRSCVVVCSGATEDHRASRAESTIGRELEYCIGHALHHFDVIRLICEAMRIRVPEEFGDASAARKFLCGLVAH
jgi:hypothetical protein